MAFDQSTIENTLHAIIASVSGKTVIWLDQNGPRPAKPYIGLRLNSLVSVGVDAVLPPDSVTGYANIVGNREFTLYTTYYGVNGMGVLETVSSSFCKLAVQQLMQSAGLVFVDSFGVMNITELLDMQYEQRSSLDILLRTSSVEIDQNIGVIETVNLHKVFKKDNVEVYTKDESITIS